LGASARLIATAYGIDVDSPPRSPSQSPPRRGTRATSRTWRRERPATRPGEAAGGSTRISPAGIVQYAHNVYYVNYLIEICCLPPDAAGRQPIGLPGLGAAKSLQECPAPLSPSRQSRLVTGGSREARSLAIRAGERR